jgi:hypothetical protein
MKAILMIQRVLAQFNLHSYLGKLVDFDFQDVTILALLVHHGVRPTSSRVHLWRLMLGTTYRLNNSEKENMHIAEVAGSKEEGPSRPPTTQWRPSWVCECEDVASSSTWAMVEKPVLHSFL